MNKIKVSILIPAFNVAPYLEECLCSLTRQTLKEIEIIVVNDGSTDNTGEIAEKYAAGDRRIRVYHQSNQGISGARNAGISYVRGKYIGFVDGDDTVSADAFEKLYRQAEIYTADIVLGSLLYSYEDGSTGRVGDKSEVFSAGREMMTGKECFRSLLETNSYVPMVCGNLYRTDFIREHGLHFEALFHEDEFFTPYALYYAGCVTDFKEDFYYYRQRPDSIMHNDSNLKDRAESLWFIGNKLHEFAKTVCLTEGMMEDIYTRHGDFLCNSAQDLYEKMMERSSRKCLFIFSESGIGAQYGIGTYIAQLIACFSPSEWDVNVVTLQTQTEKVSWQMKEGVAYYEIPLPCEMWCQTSLSRREKYSKSVFYYLSARMPRPKQVYCHFNFFGSDSLATWCKEKWQARIFFTLHYTDWSFDLLGDREWLKRILADPCGRKEQFVARRFEQEKNFMLTCCDGIIAIARHSYQMLKDLYGIPEEKLVLIPNGLQDEYQARSEEECKALRQKYGLNERDRLIIFAGRLDRVKGVWELIEAFKLLRKEMPDVKLILAGSGRFVDCLKTINPDWSHIILTGFIPKEQLYELYAISDVGVVPSIHEEFGYVAIEMMLNMLPIVVHNTTGLSEITDNGEYGIGFHFNADKNSEPLKEALVKALTEQQSERQRVKGRKRVLDTYSLPLFRQRIKNLYSCMESPCRSNTN